MFKSSPFCWKSRQRALWARRYFYSWEFKLRRPPLVLQDGLEWLEDQAMSYLPDLKGWSSLLRALGYHFSKFSCQPGHSTEPSAVSLVHIFHLSPSFYSVSFSELQLRMALRLVGVVRPVRCALYCIAQPMGAIAASAHVLALTLGFLASK
jgi:hypothetical protein